MKHTPRVLVVATSRKTRGGITSVVKAHETGIIAAGYRHIGMDRYGESYGILSRH